MTPKPEGTKPEDKPVFPHAHIPAEPVSNPSPTPDGPKPIPAGDLEVEKFNVTADTGGGD